MKIGRRIALLFFCLCIFACKGPSEGDQAVPLDPAIYPDELERDYMQWWTYHSYYISLSSDFTGLGEESDTIPKKLFLNRLNTGDFVPVKIKSGEGVVYKLYRLSSAADKSISATIKNESSIALKHLNMEGETFPKFGFTDLAGNYFTSENTSGKLTIFKTWFIGCKACVEEFPELNELVDRHKNENDIVFISLALDAASELEKFLLKKPFRYKVVPEMEDFIEKTLGQSIYPSHIIVDREGKIVKVVNKASEMISVLEQVTKPVDAIPPPRPM